MLRSKLHHKALMLSFTLISAACISSEIESQAFQCVVSKPLPFEVLIHQQNNRLELVSLSLDGKVLHQSEQLTGYMLDRYHRALVDEKSLAFNLDGSSILVSEYHSEELGDAETILSVTINSANQTQYYECEIGSSSNLELLFQH